MGRQPLPTDTILGSGNDQYRIDTVLGPGGFGITYLAKDLRFDRDVAVKEYFPAEFAWREGTTNVRPFTRGVSQTHFEQGKRHFLDEARTLAKFRHENIVRVLNLFEQYNTAYMVLEFEEGQSFKSWLRTLGRRPTQAELDGVLWPMLAALEVVHAKGMFHRDIAPDNIIIRQNGQPVLIDFGAARHFVREHSHTIGAIVKHGYSPPEQYTLDTKLQGAWSDIYSLSATLYAAMIGEAPDEASRRQLTDTVLPVERRLEPGRRSQYRPSFLAALNAGLQLKPRERPQTVAAFRALLERSDVASEIGAAGPEHRVIQQGALAGDGSDGGSENRVHALAKARPSRVAASIETTGEGGAGRVVAGVDALASYPETAARLAGLAALAVAGAASAVFLAVGGIEHPGGLAAAMLVCVGLIAAGLERLIAVWRVRPDDRVGATAAAAVMSALGLAIYWLPLFFWPISVLLVMCAAAFAQARFARWVPSTLLGLALIHLAIAAVFLAGSIRLEQKDPYFLPLMAASLAILAGIVLASALRIRRRWEPVTA